MYARFPCTDRLLSTHVVGPAWATSREQIGPHHHLSKRKSNQIGPCLQGEGKINRERSRIQSSRRLTAAKVKPTEKRSSKKTKVTARPSEEDSGQKRIAPWRDRDGEPSSESLTKVNKLVFPEASLARAYTHLDHPGSQNSFKIPPCGKPPHELLSRIIGCEAANSSGPGPFPKTFTNFGLQNVPL